MSCYEEYKVGAYVEHSVYGFGQIKSVDGEKCIILFDNGFQDRFHIEYLVRSNGASIVYPKRYRVSDLLS